MQYDEKTVDRKQIYQGKIIKVESVTVELQNGKQAARDIVIHPGAAVVIPITEDGELYLVRQYRKPLERTLLELPAGKLDSNECPEECARRELKEETGLDADNIKYLISIHTTPGFCNEEIHIFVATGLHQGEIHTDEDEFIISEKLPVSKLVNMVLNREITDAKSIIGIFLAEKILKGELPL